MNKKSKKSIKPKLNRKILNKPKSKGLFDHINAIRITKDPNYFTSLTDEEQKTFNHWLILHALSMDVQLLKVVMQLWQDGYYNAIPSPQFYTLLIDLVPKTYAHVPWLKRLRKRNEPLLHHIASAHSVSTREADEYLSIYMQTDAGLQALVDLFSKNGMADKEIEKLMTAAY